MSETTLEPNVTDDFVARVADYVQQAQERRYSMALAVDVPVNARTNGLDVALCVASGRCRVLGFGVDNTSSSTVYVQLFDSTAKPANSSVPIRSWPLLANTSLDIMFETHGRWFGAGCWIVGSSTETTLTILTSVALFIDSQRM